MKTTSIVLRDIFDQHDSQGVTKRCRLSLLTNSALVIRVQRRGEGGVAGLQPMSTAVHITWHGAQIKFGDLPPYVFNLWRQLKIDWIKYPIGSQLAGISPIRLAYLLAIYLEDFSSNYSNAGPLYNLPFRWSPSWWCGKGRRSTPPPSSSYSTWSTSWPASSSSSPSSPRRITGTEQARWHHCTLIKKKIKFRVEQLQTHIWQTASSYMGKFLRISSYISKP